MRVIVLKSFTAMVAGEFRSWTEGQTLDLPEGADWLRAGLVAAVEAPAVEESAKPARRGKKAGDGS